MSDDFIDTSFLKGLNKSKEKSKTTSSKKIDQLLLDDLQENDVDIKNLKKSIFENDLDEEDLLFSHRDNLVIEEDDLFDDEYDSLQRNDFSKPINPFKKQEQFNFVEYEYERPSTFDYIQPAPKPSIDEIRNEKDKSIYDDIRELELLYNEFKKSQNNN